MIFSCLVDADFLDTEAFYAYRTVAENFRLNESGLLPVIVVPDEAAKSALAQLAGRTPTLAQSQTPALHGSGPPGGAQSSPRQRLCPFH
jgi:hypothetical protein